MVYVLRIRTTLSKMRAGGESTIHPCRLQEREDTHLTHIAIGTKNDGVPCTTEGREQGGGGVLVRYVRAWKSNVAIVEALFVTRSTAIHFSYTDTGNSSALFTSVSGTPAHTIQLEMLLGATQLSWYRPGSANR